MKISAMIHSITAEVFQRELFWVRPNAAYVSGPPNMAFERGAKNSPIASASSTKMKKNLTQKGMRRMVVSRMWTASL